jgi:hypothetical protein
VEGFLWYSDGEESALYKLDAANGETLTVHRIPGVSASLSYNGGHLWQVTGSGYLDGSKNVLRYTPNQAR